MSAQQVKEKGHTLFVYGTLKQDFPNHRFLAGGRFLGYARTVKEYGLYMYEHPLVYAGEAISPVRGEAYVVDDAILDRIDAVQHHPKHYCREEIEIVLESGRRMQAWIYFYPDKVGDLIESGIFDMAVEAV